MTNPLLSELSGMRISNWWTVTGNRATGVVPSILRELGASQVGQTFNQVSTVGNN
jgi:hypothetical protein